MSKKLEKGFQKQRLVIPDSSNKGNDIVADINWNDSAKGKYIRFTLGNKVSIVKKDHLMSILFMLGNLKEQEAILSPFVRKVNTLKFTKMIGISTVKDIRKGELINVLLDFSFNPETNQITLSKGSKFGLTHNR
jgi:hypothetical protein